MATAGAKASWLNGFPELCDYLYEQGVTFHADARTQTATLRLRAGVEDTPLRVRWSRSRSVVRIAQTLVKDIPVEQIGAVQRAVELLNLVCRAAGFRVLADERIVYFRLEVARDADGRVRMAELSRALRTAAIAALEYTPLLCSIANGEPRISARLAASIGLVPAVA